MRSRPRWVVTRALFRGPGPMGGIYIIRLFGGAPWQCPRTSTAFHGYFHDIPRTPADTPRATVDLPRASTGIPWASTECRGTPWRPMALAMAISTAIPRQSPRKHPRQSPRKPTDTSMDTSADIHGNTHGHVRGTARGNPRTRPRTCLLYTSPSPRD